MTIANAIREVFKALEWAVNSEFVFYLTSTIFGLILLYILLCGLGSVLREKFIWGRRRHDE